ncbi:Concanavalin A-like lectin/glucanase [Mycena chlorophos]|uniref:Concanavalin A-like lectin/glucanase n=1 Tax=Mycena chlorophos TaxID=658473 RepID=A0A8H6WJ14_MYCCL|nr:Concanavalin A-like lectin/glucanase [Mycena chlorophos]
MILLHLLPFVLSLTGVARAASCPCGYKDSNGNVWREAIQSDFTQASGALAAVNANWIVSTDLEEQSPLHIQYTASNVFEYQDALGLQASAYTGSGTVNCAQIFTNRKDILYGSFRMRAQVPSVPGVVFGFFTYIDDSQEQDIEFLSYESDYYQSVWYTDQPGSTAGASKNVIVPGADFTTFGNHRLDWLPSKTVYSYSGNGDSGAAVSSSTTISVNVPTTPSEFILNVWSNGDPGWSNGPPTANAIATVQYVDLYFNSTSLSAASFSATCAAAGHVAPCSV